MYTTHHSPVQINAFFKKTKFKIYLFKFQSISQVIVVIFSTKTVEKINLAKIVCNVRSDFQCCKGKAELQKFFKINFNSIISMHFSKSSENGKLKVIFTKYRLACCFQNLMLTQTHTPIFLNSDRKLSNLNSFVTLRISLCTNYISVIGARKNNKLDYIYKN